VQRKSKTPTKEEEKETMVENDVKDDIDGVKEDDAESAAVEQQTNGDDTHKPADEVTKNGEPEPVAEPAAEPVVEAVAAPVPEESTEQNTEKAAEEEAEKATEEPERTASSESTENATNNSV